jgi:hypothetical protein
MASKRSRNHSKVGRGNVAAARRGLRLAAHPRRAPRKATDIDLLEWFTPSAFSRSIEKGKKIGTIFLRGGFSNK